MCLEGRRQDAVIATKFGFREGPNTPPYSPQQIDEAVTRSLNKLKTNYVDLLQVCTQPSSPYLEGFSVKKQMLY